MVKENFLYCKNGIKKSAPHLFFFGLAVEGGCGIKAQENCNNYVISQADGYNATSDKKIENTNLTISE